MTVCSFLRSKNLGQKNNEGMVLKSKKNNRLGVIVGVSALLLVVFAPIQLLVKKRGRGFVISMVHTATYYDDLPRRHEWYETRCSD